MSVRYQLLKTGIRLMGIKKMFRLPSEKMLTMIEKLNRNRGFRVPADKKCIYEDRLILQKYHCLTMQAGPKKSKKAVLFLFGGGFLLGPDKGDYRTARDIGERSGSDVWFPCYPLCTDHCITAAYDMALECYRQMLDEYAPEKISFLGFSSGAALAVGILLHSNATKSGLPMPRQVIACSPGAAPVTDVERQKARALDGKDRMVSSIFMENISTFMEHGQNPPLYMISGPMGDFTGLPKIYFYYGSDEVLYAEAEYFAAACEKHGVPYHLTVGQGMCHCYPMLPWFPEGRRAYDEIVGILSY